jgi:hypothetical protein
VLASSAIDCGYEPRSCQTKEYKIGICCFSAKNAALRKKSKDCLARNQNNVSEWSDISTQWLLLAHLAKGNVSFYHHLAPVVLRLSVVVCHPLTIHILIFSSGLRLNQMKWSLVGSIYGRSSVAITHFVPIR